MSDPKIFHLLQRAHSELFRASDLALRERHGIGTAQQAVLFSLLKRDGAAIGYLAKQLHMGKSGLTGLVDRMETAGLVRRETDPNDARSCKVFLKSKGRDLAEATLPTTRQVNATLIEAFDRGERATIERFLNFVAESSEAIVSTAVASGPTTPEFEQGSSER
ncbi:MAG: MarR family winged helix-turn-helix transcriptional regulator [Erythrobacter sp.]|nr:MarR family winged helix-turn-helix transcriptional regulator [Erythrobacter sp.]